MSSIAVYQPCEERFAMIKAIVVDAGGRSAAVQDVPIPKLRDGWVLVKVNAIGLNPTDWKHVDYGAAEAGCRLGCDYAGVVESIGSGVTKFKKGDRIAGAVHVAKEEIAMHIPDNLTDEEAATLGVSTITVGQSLYKIMQLPWPDVPAADPATERPWILIHAGSTATALLGIQYAKLSGLLVVATASPHSFDIVRMSGADAVFDYKSPKCAADIKTHTQNKLRYAWDCTGTGTELCAAALSDIDPSVYVATNVVNEAVLKETNPKVGGPYFTLAYDVFGEEYVWLDELVPPKPDELVFARRFFERSHKLLAEGAVKPVRSLVNKTGDGLDGALRGLDALRNDAMAGTPWAHNDDAEPFGVLIIGAGISGINSAYRLQTELPDVDFLVLEGRNNIGGTWDLFKYPGVRSDTDLYSYGFAWYPWPYKSRIAEGPLLMSYLSAAVSRYRIRQRIRLRHNVVSAEWSWAKQRWIVTAWCDGQEKRFIAQFLVMGTGYFDYQYPLEANIPGLANFKGKVINPQHWPDNYDYSKKKIAVIGSGATAVSLFPALVDGAAHVTMIQRSPSYIFSGKNSTYTPPWLEKYLDMSIVQTCLRVYFVLVPYLLGLFCLYFPNWAREIVRKEAEHWLPSRVPQDPHFKPRYNPWEQRMCFSPGGVFYRALHRPNANIITGEIETVIDSGIRMKSGESVEADVIVTATGFRMALGGRISLKIDGESVSFKKRLIWNGAMMEGIPNMMYMIGYTNHSWTLGADSTAFILVRLLKHMARHGIQAAVPKIHGHIAKATQRMWQLSSTYVSLAEDELPVYGRKGPWKPRNTPPVDLIHARWGNVTNGLQFIP
ncbi:hypothetical protein DL765_009403 [Monosporascus sp. GIB2]|nr:hypothetical protein DL765_009403 [Monosporascus sp. GIB2]